VFHDFLPLILLFFVAKDITLRWLELPQENALLAALDAFW